jgi:hypothetical protein
MDNTEGKKFREEVVEMVYEVCDGISKKMCERIETGCKQLSQNLYNSLIIRTSDILKRAEKTLNISFEMKQLAFETLDIQLEHPSIDRIVLKRNENRLHLNDTYFIHRQDLLHQCNELIQENLQRIQQNIEKWSHNVLNNSFSNYLSELETYLGDYVKLIQSSLNDMNLSNTDREELQQNLQHLINELTAEFMKLTTEQK